MADRREFLQALGIGMAAVVAGPWLAKVNATPVSPARTRILKVRYSTELAQDLKNYHGLDAHEELARAVLNEVRREVGSTRGTLQSSVAVDPNTFQHMMYFKFKNDGQFGPEENWGWTHE